jgi:hypothetical protein
LDEALAELPGPHREALVLRYFGEKTLAEVAAALRITEDAATPRVSRAVRQLRAALGARGGSVSPATLAGALAAHGVGSAPTTVLKTTITAAAKIGGAPRWFSRLSTSAKTATGKR